MERLQITGLGSHLQNTAPTMVGAFCLFPRCLVISCSVEGMLAGIKRKLRENQGVFGRGRAYEDRIFCFCMWIEKWVEFQLPTLAVIVACKAAIDSVRSTSMWHTLSDYGILPKCIQPICCVYENCNAAVSEEGEVTDWIRVGSKMDSARDINND